MKLFADRKRSALLAGAPTQLSVNPVRLFALLAAVVVISSSTFALAQAGTLDTTFGTGGIFGTSFTQNGAADNAIAIQSDGKIIVGGLIALSTGGGQAALLRLNTNGTLDSSFGTGGIVTSDFSIDDGAIVFGIAIQPNGQIVAAAEGGFLDEGAVGRFNADGSVDTTFGTNGFATSNSVNSAPGASNAMALQPNGSILVTGGGFIARYTSTGQVDTTFGTNGVAILNSLVVTGMALQSDGKILVTTGSGTETVIEIAPALPSAIAGSISRYNANGTLDTTFGISGQAACVASAGGIAIQSNGKIVVAGTITSELANYQYNGRVYINNLTGFGLVRYNPNGSIDTTFNPGIGFGSGGGIITGFGSSFPYSGAFALAIQSNGEIVVAGVAGYASFNAYVPPTQLASASLALARYTTTGLLDTSFGTNGTVVTTVGQSNISSVSALAIQSDGKIVAAGNSAVPQRDAVVNNFAVARYLAQ
jgi:uncharacterized delta-60 repeat protein